MGRMFDGGMREMIVRLAFFLDTGLKLCLCGVPRGSERTFVRREEGRKQKWVRNGRGVQVSGLVLFWEWWILL